jgi:REP element-mobilizing transposase RayT
MVGDVPLAYFITFRCYGTWLHGDQRGSTDRFHNQYGAPFMEQDENWRRREQGHLTHSPVALNPEQRKIVERVVRETCSTRKWTLLAINARMTHVHVVVSSNGARPETVLNALKSNATRTLRERGHWKSQYSPWSDSGSKRYLWNQQSIDSAVDYVLNRQDGP